MVEQSICRQNNETLHMHITKNSERTTLRGLEDNAGGGAAWDIQM